MLKFVTYLNLKYYFIAGIRKTSIHNLDSPILRVSVFFRIYSLILKRKTQMLSQFGIRTIPQIYLYIHLKGLSYFSHGSNWEKIQLHAI